MQTVDTRITAALWLTAGDFEEDHEDTKVMVEVERDEPNEISLHTFIDGRGSLITYTFDREEALNLAAQILNAVRLR